MEENNKRIVKNTMFLYVRMVITMGLSFFVTRIVLDKLGVSDYGIYNVVGGFVSLFTILNNILQTGTRRFIALRIGEGNFLKLKNTFSTAIVIHLIIAGVVFVLLETIGLWLLNTQLNFEESRIVAANWVYQISIIGTILTITQTPYTAAVTAHEKFNMYAYMSIFEIVAIIIMLYLLIVIPGDKLIIYSIILLFISTINLLAYRVYCINRFKECSISLHIDKTIFKEMISFSGWSTLGQLSVMLNSSGVSVLINIFFSTVVNAARGLAGTVDATINQLVNGFTIAAEPQLVKYYGAGDKKHFEALIFNVSRYTLFLLSIIIVPLLLEIDYVLKLWLNEVPQYTATFIRIQALVSIISYSSRMLILGIIAIGRTKESNLFVSPIYLLNLPLVYITLKIGGLPQSVYYIASIPALLGMIGQLQILHKYINFPSSRYIVDIFLKSIFIISLALIIPYWIQTLMSSGLLRFIIVCSTSVICTISLLYKFSLNQETRLMVKQKIFKIIKH